MVHYFLLFTCRNKYFYYNFLQPRRYIYFNKKRSNFIHNESINYTIISFSVYILRRFLFLISQSSSGVGEEDVKGGAKTPSKTQGG